MAAIPFHAPCWVGMLLVASLAHGNDADPNVKENRIVARQDYEAPNAFAPPEILRRRFWNMLPNDAKKSTALGDIPNEPMVRESASLFHIPDLHVAGEDPLAVKADQLRALNPDPDVPFVVYSTAGRPPFRCLDDFRADKKSYEKWKREHPNFLGFWTGTEWDNEFIGCALANFPGVMAQSKRVCSPTAFEQIEAMKKWVAADRDSAVRGLHQCYQGLRRYFFDDPDKMLFLRAAWTFDHYALDWGAGMAILETTNTGLYRHQVGLFAVRGAARQYGKPWEWYMATYYNGYEKNGKRSVNNEPNYISATDSDAVGFEESSGPDFGMSVSLKRRDMYLAYLAGASIVQHEDWPRVFCRLERGKPDKWSLSLHGEAMKEWYAFTQQHPERGISYAPVALLLPFNQGMPVSGGNPWTVFPAERPDVMIDAFMYTIVPNSQHLPQGKEGCLSNSPYGDIHDVLVSNPTSGPVSLAALMNYKVAILLGKQNIDAPLAERLREYVRQGGTLIINARQVTGHLPADFLGAKPTGETREVAGNVKNLLGDKTVALEEPYDYKVMELAGAEPMWTDARGGVLATVHEHGRGRVVLVTVDYLLPRKQPRISGSTTKIPLVELLMGQIVREVLPMEVRGDIEYGLCKVPDGWWVYLINNKGVTKYTKTPEELDASETARVTIDARALPVASARELREDKPLAAKQGTNTFSIEVGPGDIRVVKISTRKNE